MGLTRSVSSYFELTKPSKGAFKGTLQPEPYRAAALQSLPTEDPVGREQTEPNNSLPTEPNRAEPSKRAL